MQNDNFLELEFIYTFFMNGIYREIIWAKSNSEAFAELHKRGYTVEMMDYFVRYNKIDKSYDLMKIK